VNGRKSDRTALSDTERNLKDRSRPNLHAGGQGFESPRLHQFGKQTGRGDSSPRPASFPSAGCSFATGNDRLSRLPPSPELSRKQVAAELLLARCFQTPIGRDLRISRRSCSSLFWISTSFAAESPLRANSRLSSSRMYQSVASPYITSCL